MIAGSLQIDASVVSELHLEMCTLFLRVSCIFQHFQRSIFLRESIFWSPRALTPVSARGLGVALTPGVHSQVLGLRFCINNPKRLWTYTSCLKESTKTTTTATTPHHGWPVCRTGGRVPRRG